MNDKARQFAKRRVIVQANSEYCALKVKQFAKTYINENELNPILTEDPILLQQCRTRGYVTIPIAGELRNVVCTNPALHEGEELKETVKCPFCGKSYCIKHMTEHLDAPLYSSPRGREIRIDNPELYSTMPSADLRTEMSSWDNEELARNALDTAIQRVDQLTEEGGAGSGFHGHHGVEGQVGGSSHTPVFHGTRLSNRDEILQHGLNQSRGYAQKVYSTTLLKEAEEYGYEGARFNHDPIFCVVGLEISQAAVDSGDVKTFALADDQVWYTANVEKGFPPQWITAVSTYKINYGTSPGQPLYELIGVDKNEEKGNGITAYVPVNIGEQK